MIRKQKGLTRLFRACLYSYKGLRHAFQHEAAFRQEFLAAMVLIPAACLLDVAVTERILLVTSVVLVLIVELLNTGIEAVVDRVGFELHELAGIAKDVGSAAVLVSILLWLYVWGSILLTL